MPTGVNNRVAAYAYRGGSVFDRRDFYIGAAISSPDARLRRYPRARPGQGEAGGTSQP